jgi:hypothetical protein
LNSNQENLYRSYNELVEYRHVIKKANKFFVEVRIFSLHFSFSSSTKIIIYTLNFPLKRKICLHKLQIKLTQNNISLSFLSGLKKHYNLLFTQVSDVKAQIAQEPLIQDKDKDKDEAAKTRTLSLESPPSAYAGVKLGSVLSFGQINGKTLSVVLCCVPHSEVTMFVCVMLNV